MTDGKPDPTTDQALATARRALEVERAHQNRGLRIRIDAVEDLGKRLFRLRVVADEPLDPTALTGGRAVRVLADGDAAMPFTADIIEIDADDDAVYVEMSDPRAAPTPGAAMLWPHDFLEALRRLLDRSAPLVRTRLAAALRDAESPGPPVVVGGPSALAPAWRHAHVTVWGPPGTGKTHTVAHEVATLLRDPAERVLLVSTTNRATDELALRLGRILADEGRLAGVMRLGIVARRGSFELAELTGMLPAIDAELSGELRAAEAAVAEAREGSERAAALHTLTQLRRGQPSLTRKVADPKLRCAITTLHSALRALASDYVQRELEAGRPPFTTVVLDEAGLVGRLPAAALALMASRRVVRAGDPRQLSPIATAARSMQPDERRWLATSTLAHLTDDVARPDVQRLQIQHRMHPQIRAAVSALSYGGKLADAPAVVSRRWAASSLRHLPRATWYVLDEAVEHRADLHAERAGRGSRARPAIRVVLTALIDAMPALADQAGLFITPYRAQVTLVAKVLSDLGLHRWRTSSVHAQQGSEADVVVFDTVHASSTGWSPAEWVRMVNVGMSRARELLFLVATRAELDQPYLRPLRRHMAARVLRRGAWVSVDEVDDANESLFAPARSEAPVAAEVAPDWFAPDIRLGGQIDARKRMRPRLSHEQARLVHRDLSDAGPRLVRGVAGSGKTLVLAHWVVRALRGLGIREVVVVHGNKALRPLLQRMIAVAWDDETGGVPSLPWDRVVLIHIGDLLSDLRTEHDLPPPEGPWDYEEQARSLLASPVVGTQRFQALFVDEAQDLGHDTLRLLIQLTRTDEQGRPAVLLFHDNAQNVYRRRAPSWRELGLDLRGRSDVMKESFRTTRPNTELALNVLDRLRPLRDDPDLRELMQTSPPLLWHDAQAGWRAEFCAVDGQPPQVHIADSRDEEVAMIVAQVQAWIRHEGVGAGDIRVLAVGPLRDTLARALHDAGVPVTQRTTNGFEDCDKVVVVTTPHSFKGHDAEIVVVAGADKFFSRDGVLAEALYVALTRARTLMWVTATRGEGSAAVIKALEHARGPAGPRSEVTPRTPPR